MGQRLVTGVVAGAGFIAVLALGGWYYSGLLAVLALIGYDEYVRMNGQSRRRWDVRAAYAAVALMALPRLPFGWQAPSVDALAWLILFVLLAATVVSKNRIHLEHASLLFLGVLYIGFGFRAMAEARELPHGFFWSLLAFACIWASDVGAYTVGRYFGRRKLWPAISPNKTIEGAVGGLVIAVATAVVFAACRPAWLGYGQAVAVGAVAAVAGQLGDLIQSAYKRLRGVKDSGAIFPGHGGVLDRTDSWLIVFPLIQLLGLLAH
jgi:phosphatidate cytidylyltransferase